MKSQIKASIRHRGVLAASSWGAGLTAALVLVFSGSAGAACTDELMVQNHNANPALNAVASVSGSGTWYVAQTSTSTGTSTHPQDEDALDQQDQQHQQDLQDQQHQQSQQHQPGQDQEDQDQHQQPAPTQ